MGSLFQPFVQLDNALARQNTGTGLGLALVRRLAEQMGGSVGVESSPGKGSRFWFDLPLYQVMQKQEDKPVEGILLSERMSSQHSNEGLVRQIFQGMDAQVVIIPFDSDAASKAAKIHPDAILLDFHIASGSGEQVLSALRQHPQSAKIPIMLFSAEAGECRDAPLEKLGYPVISADHECLAGAISRTIAPKPLARALLLVCEHADGHTAPSSVSRKEKVLIVEDNPTNLESMQNYLQVKGFCIGTASSGYEALDCVGEFRPDIILMDIQMPGMDGLQTILRLRSMENFSKTPIIAVTALAMTGDRERCLAAGANEYISKPVIMKQLVALIEKTLKESNFVTGISQAGPMNV